MTDFKDILTVRKAISEIRKGLRENDADSRMSNRYIYAVIKKHTADIIRQRSDAFRILKQQSFYQTIQCMIVEEAPTIDPCCGVRSKCRVYRTRDKLPRMYEDSYGAIIKNVWSIDGTFGIQLQPTTPDGWEKIRINPWGQKGAMKDIYYFYSDGYLYFPMSSWRKIKVRAYFQEDISALNLCDGCGSEPSTSCLRYMDNQFFIPPDLWKFVAERVLQELATIYKQIVPDVLINKDEAKKQ